MHAKITASPACMTSAGAEKLTTLVPPATAIAPPKTTSTPCHYYYCRLKVEVGSLLFITLASKPFTHDTSIHGPVDC